MTTQEKVATYYATIGQELMRGADIDAALRAADATLQPDPGVLLALDMLNDGMATMMLPMPRSAVREAALSLSAPDHHRPRRLVAVDRVNRKGHRRVVPCP